MRSSQTDDDSAVSKRTKRLFEYCKGSANEFDILMVVMFFDAPTRAMFDTEAIADRIAVLRKDGDLGRDLAISLSNLLANASDVSYSANSWGSLEVLEEDVLAAQDILSRAACAKYLS